MWQDYARNANIQAAALAEGLAALPGFALLYPTGKLCPSISVDIIVKVLTVP